VVIVLLYAGGCGIGGTLPSDGGSRKPAQELTPDATGWIDRSTTGATGIEGSWYVFADGLGFDGQVPSLVGDCQRGGYPPDQCSMIITPNPTVLGFPPTDGLGMCVIGISARVIGADFSRIWGAGIGFNFNAAGSYDALANGVTGIAFDIDSEPPPDAAIRVQLQTVPTEFASPSWGGATSPVSPVHAGHNRFKWEDVGGPSYLAQPPPFDPSQLVGMDFFMPAAVDGAKSFSFCIDHVTALVD
jgi:hypothetical protein